MKNILNTLKAMPECSSFLELIKKAKLESTFSGRGPITVFVPDNKACECVEVKKAKGMDAGAVVKYHVIAEKIRLLDLIPFKLRKTLHGKNVCLEAVNVQVNASLITREDIKCSNGYIHIIDSIMAPKNVSCAPTTNYHDYNKMRCPKVY